MVIRPSRRQAKLDQGPIIPDSREEWNAEARVELNPRLGFFHLHPACYRCFGPLLQLSHPLGMGLRLTPK